MQLIMILYDILYRLVEFIDSLLICFIKKFPCKCPNMLSSLVRNIDWRIRLVIFPVL